MILVSIATPQARARLDESKEECSVRYGRVVEIRDQFRPDFPQFVFAKNDVDIRIRFLNGKAGQLIISSTHGMSKATLTEILQANAQGLQWKIDPNAKVENPATYRESHAWVRSDGKATATYVRMAGIDADILTIDSAEFSKAFNAKATGF